MPKSKKTQQTALITGGAKRIGKAICLALAGQGFNIALHYNRSKSRAKKIADEINKKGGTCALFACDLSEPEQVERLIPHILTRFANLDVLINNASIFNTSTIKSSRLATLGKQFTVNFEAPYILTSQFARLCSKGNIINILDTNIVNNTTCHTNYLLSKKTLYELTKLSAVELAPQIRVNGIAPGLILPPENSKNGYLKRLTKNIPLRKKGNVAQIAKIVQFFLNNDYITGQVIFNDGGEHLL